jgi:hypothetical protein
MRVYFQLNSLHGEKIHGKATLSWAGKPDRRLSMKAGRVSPREVGEANGVEWEGVIGLWLSPRDRS